MTTRFPSPPPHYNTSATRDDQFSNSNDHTNVSTSTVNLDAVQPAPVPHRSALTPYLTLPHYLSLTWLAYPVISLLFVAFRLIDSTASAKGGVADAKTDLMASCLAAQRAASSAASMPRYLAIGSNDAIQASVDAAMDAARLTMILSLTIVEAIIEFVIDIYRSTFLCFLELIVRGGLAILIGAVQEVSDFVNTTLGAIRTNIQNDVASANQVIQTAVSAINKVTSIVNVNLNVPQFSIPSLNALANVTLPTDFEDALIKLNSSLPTLDQLRDGLDSLIEKPFDVVKADINATFAAISFNATTFALPEARTLSFCDDMDTSFIDDLGRDLVKVARIGAGIIVAAAVLIVLGNMFLQWWRWSSLQNHLEYIREAWSADPTVAHSPKAAEYRGTPTPSMSMTNHNLLVFLNTSEHPLMSRILDQISKRFRLTPTQHTNARFFISYATYPPAIVCLLIGLIGLLSVQIQLAAIHPLEAHYTAQANAGVSSFNTQIAAQLSAGMANDSATYAAQVNAQIAAVQTTLNNGVFGWVNQTTTSLNDTVAGFYAEVQSIVNSTFGGTILDSPAQEFVRCMIGSKVQSIENALTFLNENFQVNMPTMNPNVLMLSNSSVSEVTSPIANAAIGAPANGSTNAATTQPQSQGLVAKLIARYVSALHRERVMYAILLGIWLFVALCAIGIILWHSYGVDRVREWKRKRYNRKMGLASGGDDHSAYGGEAPNTGVTPWSPPRGAMAIADGPFPKGDYNTRNLAPPPNGAARVSDGILAQDAALAQAYLSSTGLRAQSQYEDRRYQGPALEEYEYDAQGEKTPLPENLRTFTPLQTPKPSTATFPESATAVPASSNGQQYSTFADPPTATGADLEKGDASRQKSRGLSWGIVSGKLRNDSRRVTAREWDFDNNLPVSKFDHSPAPETSTNGWFSRAVNAVWGGATGAKKSREENRQTIIEPYNFESTGSKSSAAKTERRVINLDTDDGHVIAPTPLPVDMNMRQLHHQSIFSTPPRPNNFTLGNPPAPRPRMGAAPAPVPVPAPVNDFPSINSRRAEFPQSMQSINGEFGYASPPRAAPLAVNTPTSPPSERPRYLSTQYYSEQSNSALPIHHQFVSPELTEAAVPDTPNPFGDHNIIEERGHRSRPSRSMFPPPGLLTTGGVSNSRTLTPLSPGSEAMRRRSHNRGHSSLGAMQAAQNPFVGSPSPFEDPVFPRGPPTPSAVSFISGHSGAPRAL